MESIRALYKIGNGPSSSHTMGPEKAARAFKNEYPEADLFVVYLYGSLALTGKGHLTDEIIKKTLDPISSQLVFDTDTVCSVHPNTMDFVAFKGQEQLGSWRVYSVGGGTIQIEGQTLMKEPSIYPHTRLTAIKKYCMKKGITYADYVYETEDDDIKSYFKEVWRVMCHSIVVGLSEEGVLPGRLGIQRRAQHLYQKSLQKPRKNKDLMLSAYAYAVGECNASGGMVVTAPTCGAAGVLPAVLRYIQEEYGFSDAQILDGIAVAGLFGNLIKENASISGAACGCQAEIGSACSMASAAYAYLKGLTLDEIEDAAEMAMENHLGLTCDPIYGLVQIPCIQRNAAAAMRAIDVVDLVEVLGSKQKVSFDMVIDTMYETGKDLQSHYRETSTGGLAKKYCYDEEHKEVQESV